MEKKTLDDIYKNVCEEHEWNVSVDEDGYVDLRQYSPAGEDFGFTVEAEDFVENVRDYVIGFDIDEHVMLLMEAKKNGFAGVPSLRDLLDDAEAIDNMLNNLLIGLVDAERSVRESERMYEKYKLAWMLDHGYTLKDLIDQLEELRQENIDVDLQSIFNDWEYCYGFGSEIWADFDEFVNNELRFCKDAEVQND